MKQLMKAVAVAALVGSSTAGAQTPETEVRMCHRITAEAHTIRYEYAQAGTEAQVCHPDLTTAYIPRLPRAFRVRTLNYGEAGTVRLSWTRYDASEDSPGDESHLFPEPVELQGADSEYGRLAVFSNKDMPLERGSRWAKVEGGAGMKLIVLVYGQIPGQPWAFYHAEHPWVCEPLEDD